MNTVFILLIVSAKCFVVHPVKRSALYPACAFPERAAFVLCREMFARLQKAHFMRNPPPGGLAFRL